MSETVKFAAEIAINLVTLGVVVYMVWHCEVSEKRKKKNGGH